MTSHLGTNRRQGRYAGVRVSTADAAISSDVWIAEVPHLSQVDDAEASTEARSKIDG